MVPLYRPPPMVPPSGSQGLLWAFVPFLTFGFGTPYSFLYVAVKQRSWRLGGTAAAYGVGSAMTMALMGSGLASLGALGAALLTILWITGTVHAFTVRPSIFPRTNPRDRLNQHAIDVAKHRRTLREQARALIAEDPALAVELRIGRPDLPRAYDDGGLVDVNHVPKPTLGLLPGITEELAERIVNVRKEQGGFVSVEELAVDADLPPDLIQGIAEYAVFLR
ncbi:ComEA family DNA-binding protein [Actinomadura sp. HBU206391]|uniref:ComEA family DNA-binding protein n=1 Tax=Actinomadura sp. HBU206391 TaxID=2731692 RepID=UPI00164F5E72|nr:helix-hairpin-helix domain-containing protein [Actinomadura sp. HBU206391]MBC6457736.1 helix-hairpin-helix domain-containing protein [Actinomadura sp. HBU206391]